MRRSSLIRQFTFGLLCSVLPTQALQPSDYIGLDSIFTKEYLHLAPSRGGLLLQSPILQNMRLFGEYGTQDEQIKNKEYRRFDQLTDDQDFPLTQTAALTQHLFPSPEGSLAISGRQDFFFKRMGLKALGELCLKLDYFINSKTGQEELRLFLISKTSQNYKKKASHYAKMLIDAAKEIRNDPFSFSPYYIHDLLSAYAQRLAGNLDKFQEYLEGMKPATIFAEKELKLISKKFTKEDYYLWKQGLKESFETRLDKLIKTLTEWKQRYPDHFQNFMKQISSRLSNDINRENIIHLLELYKKNNLIKKSDSVEEALDFINRRWLGFLKRNSNIAYFNPLEFYKSQPKEVSISKKQIVKLKNNSEFTFLISDGVRRYENLPLKIDYGRAVVKGLGFSNCGEAATLSLFCFGLYDPETNTLDLSKIPETALLIVIDFFKDFDPHNPNLFNDRWASIMANLPNQNIRYVNNTEDNHCEMAGSLDNWLRIMGQLLGDEIIQNESLSIPKRIQRIADLFSTEKRKIILEDIDPNENTLTKFDFTVYAEQKASFSSQPGSTQISFEDFRKGQKPCFTCSDITEFLELPPYFYVRFLPDFGPLTYPRYDALVWRKIEQEHEEKQNLLKIVKPGQAFHLLLSLNLQTTKGKMSCIEHVIDHKQNNLSQKIPGIYKRFIIDDVDVGFNLLDKLLPVDRKLTEQWFPGLWKRLETHVISEFSDYFRRMERPHSSLYVDYLFQKQFLDHFLSIRIECFRVGFCSSAVPQNPEYYEPYLNHVKDRMEEFLTVNHPWYHPLTSMWRHGFSEQNLMFFELFLESIPDHLLHLLFRPSATRQEIESTHNENCPESVEQRVKSLCSVVTSLSSIHFETSYDTPLSKVINRMNKMPELFCNHNEMGQTHLNAMIKQRHVQSLTLLLPLLEDRPDLVFKKDLDGTDFWSLLLSEGRFNLEDIIPLFENYFIHYLKKNRDVDIKTLQNLLKHISSFKNIDNIRGIVEWVKSHNSEALTSMSLFSLLSTTTLEKSLKVDNYICLLSTLPENMKHEKDVISCIDKILDILSKDENYFPLFEKFTHFIYGSQNPFEKVKTKDFDIFKKWGNLKDSNKYIETLNLISQYPVLLNGFLQTCFQEINHNENDWKKHFQSIAQILKLNPERVTISVLSNILEGYFLPPKEAFLLFEDFWVDYLKNISKAPENLHRLLKNLLLFEKSSSRCLILSLIKSKFPKIIESNMHILNSWNLRQKLAFLPILGSTYGSSIINDSLYQICYSKNMINEFSLVIDYFYGDSNFRYFCMKDLDIETKFFSQIQEVLEDKTRTEILELVKVINHYPVLKQRLLKGENKNIFYSLLLEIEDPLDKLLSLLNDQDLVLKNEQEPVIEVKMNLSTSQDSNISSESISPQKPKIIKLSQKTLTKVSQKREISLIKKPTKVAIPVKESVKKITKTPGKIAQMIKNINQKEKQDSILKKSQETNTQQPVKNLKELFEKKDNKNISDVTSSQTSKSVKQPTKILVKKPQKFTKVVVKNPTKIIQPIKQPLKRLAKTPGKVVGTIKNSEIFKKFENAK